MKIEIMEILLMILLMIAVAFCGILIGFNLSDRNGIRCILTSSKFIDYEKYCDDLIKKGYSTKYEVDSYYEKSEKEISKKFFTKFKNQKEKHKFAFTFYKIMDENKFIMDDFFKENK